MSNVKINNAINLTYPDNFKEMSDEELTRYFSSPKNRWGVYNADEHIILSISWTKAGFLTDAEMMLMDIEARLSRRLLNYQKISSFKTKVASKKAHGIRFEYRVNDARIVQVSDMIVFKVKNRFYAIHYITRKVNAASSRLVLEEVLKSVSVG